MKIFIVQSHLGGGGAERVGVLLANGFAKRGHNVFTVTNLNDVVTYNVSKNVKVLNMVPPVNNSIVKWLVAIRNLRHYVKQYKPDVVIGIMELCAFISKMACFSIRSKVIMTEHYAFDRSPFGSLSMIEKFSKFYLNKLYDIVTVLTEADKSIIGKRLNNIVVMPNPLSVPSIETRNANKTNVLLAVGRIDAWFVKGFDVLIRAWALVNGQLIIDNEKLSSNGETWKLQIAGIGSETSLNFLKQLCKENGVEDLVEFLGFRKDVEKLYQDASIFVLSSRYEGFGLVLIEAMSQGCACVACDYKGRQREIVCPEGQGSKFNVQGSNSKPETRNLKLETRNSKVEACENGILCEPDDVEALAEAMKKMIMDDEYRESVRKKAIERSKFYSIENTMDRWEEMLNQIV